MGDGPMLGEIFSTPSKCLVEKPCPSFGIPGHDMSRSRGTSPLNWLYDGARPSVSLHVYTCIRVSEV